MKTLPDANTIMADLRRMTISEAARLYGVTPSAICVKLRRAGMPRGKSVNKRPHLAKAVAAKIVASRDMTISTVVRFTASGHKVTLPRVTMIDGPAAQSGN